MKLRIRFYKFLANVCYYVGSVFCFAGFLGVGNWFYRQIGAFLASNRASLIMDDFNHLLDTEDVGSIKVQEFQAKFADDKKITKLIDRVIKDHGKID